MSAQFLSEEQDREVDEAAACIMAGRGLTLFGLVESLRYGATTKGWIQNSLDAQGRLWPVLRDQITSKSATEREAGFNKLVGVVMALPNGLISGEEGVCMYGGGELDEELLHSYNSATYLLNFLLPRVEDSGHVADSLISGIHHLLRRTGTSLSSEFISHAVTVLFEGNNVQAYATSDRLLLFDLMEHFLDAHLEGRAKFPRERRED